jgi:hypothetical protein
VRKEEILHEAIECSECGLVGCPRTVIWLDHLCKHFIAFCHTCYPEFVALVRDEMKEGWAKIFNLETQRMICKFHYFKGGSSLCGKYILCNVIELVPEKGYGRCKICRNLKGE